MAQDWFESFQTPKQRCREFYFPTKWEHFTNTASHKQKLKLQQVFSIQIVQIWEGKKKKGQKAGQQQEQAEVSVIYFYITEFIFSGGGAHSWLHFDRELAFNRTGDTRNSQPSLLPRMLRSSCDIINFTASEPAQNDQIWLFLTPTTANISVIKC